MLIVASWSEKFRSTIGLEGVSQVWDSRPAWYFWLKNAPGVYLLELVDAGDSQFKQRTFFTALFTIKCYPYPDSRHFQSFSFQEQKLVQSKFFDNTHTPTFEYQSDISPNLFNVSAFELTVEQDGGLSLFCFETLDYLRTRYVQKTSETFPNLNLDRNFKKGEIDRNIPGLDVGHPMYDCLLCLFANASKQAPLQVQCARFAGFEINQQSGSAGLRRSDRIKGYRLRVLYNSNHDGQALALIKSISRAKSREDIFYNRKFADGHFHDNAGQELLPIKINPQWWQAAHTQYHSELASACGCH